MKILMLTPYLPFPPHSGGQTRSYNLIKFLGNRHQITLFSQIKTEEERRFTHELEKYCQKVRIFRRPAKPWSLKNILRTGLSRFPFLVIRNFSDEMKRQVEQVLAREDFDLIHAENFYVMPYIPPTTIPVVLVEQTIFYRSFQYFVDSLPWFLFWLKPILLIDINKLKYWESYYWRKADYLLAVSEEDRAQIRALVPGKTVHIVPNGVDVEFFSKVIFAKDPLPTIYFGNADFHWIENKEGAKILLDHVWPAVKNKIKNARLIIGGKIAPQGLREYLGQKDVRITEINDSREGYQRAWVEVAPLRSGGGSRTKFFEAMASGLPIVTTPEGAEGISAGEDKGVFVCRDLKKLKEKTIELLTDMAYLKKMGQKIRRLAAEEFTWQKSAQKLDSIYRSVGRRK